MLDVAALRSGCVLRPSHMVSADLWTEKLNYLVSSSGEAFSLRVTLSTDVD